MSSAVLAVIAALGASALTAGASLGVVALQERLRRKAADRHALADAVTEMLGRSMEVSLRAQAMGEEMKIRSGIMEGVDIVVTRLRKPFSALELHDWMAQDMAPLNAAWSVIWARGDQELIRRANALLSSCADLVSVSTALMPAETRTGRVRRNIVGERWTPQMQERLQGARTLMSHAREQLAQYAREVLGMAPAQLFGHDSEAGAAPRLRRFRPPVMAARHPWR
jgi:hypothetical protein